MFNFSRKKKEPESLKEVLASLGELNIKVGRISEELDGLKKKNQFSIQKIGAVRYNPFPGVGSDQSFSVSLLDANINGVVITSIYSREGSRIYAKPVKNGASEYSLSDEEKEAIKRAISPK